MVAIKVNEEAFDKLYTIISNNVWIRPKSKQVLELYNTCDSVLQQDIVLHLLREFKHVNSAEIEEIGNSIASIIERELNMHPSNTLLIAIADSDDGDIDGSQAFLQYLKNKFSSEEWTPNNFVSTIGKGAHRIKSGSNAILFDDFIGSGETIIRKHNWFREKMKNLAKHDISISILTYAIMQDAYDKLKDEGLNVISPIILKKGISDYFEKENLEVYLNAMSQLEDKLEPHANDIHLAAYTLGYKKTEAIFAFEGNNIPDNVFPIFWWPKIKPDTKRNTLFKRL